MPKRWIIPESAPQVFREEFPEISSVALQLLWNRGITTQESIDLFLGPDWSRDTFSPDLFLHMEVAVARTFQSLEAREGITVHGDYDADGVCGSAVLLSTLRYIARAFGYSEERLNSYIPHREKEGYGFSVATAEHLAKNDGTKLVITVDCGISNKPAIDRAKELGIDTIVCDHHTMPAELPESAILIHPLVPGETYPNKHLCGTGVAFKLASALIIEARKRGADFPEGYEKWLLDLVAIATVTDVMPLTGENRVLETYGLRVLNKTRRPGLKALMEIAGVEEGSVDTTAIGFRIGPRLNAAGRMRHASEALELLLAEDVPEAARCAENLQSANTARQKASDEMYREAKAIIDAAPIDDVIIVWKEGWSAGLVGLVAGKLVGDYGRPTYVVGEENGHFVGSGRTVEGFDVTAALHAASAHLDRFGGHPQACGFSVTSREKFDLACAAMRAYAADILKTLDLTPALRAEGELTLDEVDWSTYDTCQQMAPFGEANPHPVFVFRRVVVLRAESMGADGKHLRLLLRASNGKTIRAVGFGFGAHAMTLKPGDAIDFLAELSLNEWNGNRELQLRVVDIQTMSS